MIVISSMGDDVTERELLDEGAQAIIRKPVSPGKLTKAIESIFGSNILDDGDLVDDELL